MEESKYKFNNEEYLHEKLQVVIDGLKTIDKSSDMAADAQYVLLNNSIYELEDIATTLSELIDNV